MFNSRRIAQVVIILIVAGFSLLLAAGLWKGKERKGKQEAPQAPASHTEMKLTDIEFTEMEQGKRLWTLRASEASYFHDQQKTYLKSVHLTFYLENDEGEIHLESSDGVLHAGTKSIELRKDIRVNLPRGYVMTTDKADYDHQRRVVSSDHAIRLTGPGADIQGKRWEYRMTDSAASLVGVKASLVGAKLRLEKK
ncbi:MAG: LPS export ABC transporter periplasmic protein LptC [Syntrophobacteraceae bacterium]